MKRLVLARSKVDRRAPSVRSPDVFAVSWGGLPFVAAAIVVVAQSQSAGAIATAVALALAGAAMLVAARVFERERKRLLERERQALSLAELDGLTGLGNYRMFRRALQTEAARTVRHGEPFAVIVLDLDGFKAINDELGHQAGDRALKNVGHALQGELRAEDVICRHGGDEFAVIAVGADDAVAAVLAERLVDAIARAPSGTIPARRVTASAGWASFAGDTDELVRLADAALIDAKRQRRVETAAPVMSGPRSTGARTAVTRRADGPAVPARSADALTVLGNLSRALAGARTERAVCEIGIAHVAGGIDAGLAAAVRLEDDGDRLLIHATGGRMAAAAWSRRLLSERTALGVALREGRASVCLDGACSEMAVPIQVADETWGALTLESERPDVYGESERALAQAFARQIGRALGFVRMYEQLARAPQDEAHRHAVEFFGEGCLEVALLASRVGQALGLDPTEQERTYLGGLFQSVGIIRVPEEVLHKPGRLSDREFALVREHPIVGENVMRSLPALSAAAGTVRHNHERFDGAGYPDGLCGEAIPLPSRIVLVCDALVAMTSERPYRAPLSRPDALSELQREAGNQFDTDVVDALLGIMDDRTVALVN